MNGLINNILLLLFLLSLCCCQKEKKDANLVSFDVGFEDLKNFQGVCHNNGEEEVYFYRARFNPLVKFYDLEGNLKDSLSLTEVENKIGRIVLFSTTSRDTMFVMSYQAGVVACIKKDASFIFKINLDSLSALTDENRYSFSASLMPQPFYIGDNLILDLTWNGKHEKEYQTTSKLDYYHYIIRERMYSPLLCKVEGAYSSSPQIKYTLRNHYYKRSPELISNGFNDKNCVILNNKLFLILTNERDVYELNLNTLDVIDTIPIIPLEHEIPQGIKVDDNLEPSKDRMAKQELKDKCRITNMLYSQSKNQYYIFLKTGKDHSAVDELGYPFKVYIYDDQFVKKSEHSFDNDLYNPKTAMMTSKGIMIEKTIKDQPYGKKTFEFIDL